MQIPDGQKGWIHKENIAPSIVLTLDKSNIREGPGANYAIIKVIEPAVDIIILGVEGDWYYVQLQDGTKGYIKKELVFEEQ